MAYKGKRLRKKTRSARPWILAGLLAVLLLASITGTIVYIQVHSHISNSFTVAKLSIELNETFDGKDKTNVTVENTGDVPAYLRAAIVVNWKDTDGTVISANESEYSMAMGPEWIQGADSYWYCKKPTDVGQPSPALIVSCKPTDRKSVV